MEAFGASHEPPLTMGALVPTSSTFPAVDCVWRWRQARSVSLLATAPSTLLMSATECVGEGERARQPVLVLSMVAVEME